MFRWTQDLHTINVHLSNCSFCFQCFRQTLGTKEANFLCIILLLLLWFAFNMRDSITLITIILFPTCHTAHSYVPAPSLCTLTKHNHRIFNIIIIVIISCCLFFVLGSVLSISHCLTYILISSIKLRCDHISIACPLNIWLCCFYLIDILCSIKQTIVAFIPIHNNILTCLVLYVIYGWSVVDGGDGAVYGRNWYANTHLF